MAQTELVDRLLEMAIAKVGTHALTLLDPRGHVVGWLAGAERLLGYKPEEIIGQDAAVLFTPEDLEKHLSTLEQLTAAASGESEDDRWQVRKDGGRIWVSGTLTALQDDRGELLGFAKIMRNQTDQKLQIEALESRNAAFERAEQQKNTFISTLAHELRTPLSALANIASVLEGQETQSAGISSAARIMRNQVDFMSRLIEDLLEAARASAGKLPLHKEPTVLQEIIDQAIDTCRPLIEQKTQSLHRIAPDVPVRFEADATRLRQVLINLLQNAVKCTGQSGTIWVKATVEGDEAVIRVQDNGIGMAPEVMPHIFELFTQAGASTESQAGLGVGLSVVKDNVTMHGGSVQAVSDGVGKGSEFTVRLPLHPS